MYADTLRLAAPASGPARAYAAREVRHVCVAPGVEPRTADSVMTDHGLMQMVADCLGIPALHPLHD